MGFRFQKRIKILPGLRMNFSKSGVSWTVGPRGASLGIGKRGVHANVGMPGTGISYRERISGSGSDLMSALDSDTSEPLTRVPGWLAFLAGALVFGCVIAASNGSFIWSGVMLLGAVGSFVLRSKWKEAEEEYLAEKEAERAAQREEQRRARIDYLMSRHGGDAELVAKIDAGELWVGMTAEQLRDSQGEPEDIDEKVMKTRRREIWKYDEVGTNRYSTKITLDDGLVVGWDKRD